MVYASDSQSEGDWVPKNEIIFSEEEINLGRNLRGKIRVRNRNNFVAQFACMLRSETSIIKKTFSRRFWDKNHHKLHLYLVLLMI